MRAILIDWLVQVNLKFRLLQETMYMTVGIIDQFLQVSVPSTQETGDARSVTSKLQTDPL